MSQGKGVKGQKDGRKQERRRHYRGFQETERGISVEEENEMPPVLEGTLVLMFNSELYHGWIWGRKVYRSANGPKFARKSEM